MIDPFTMLKMAKPIGILVLAGFILYMVNDYRKAEQAEADALITANAAAVSAKARAQTLATANAQLEATLQAQNESINAMVEANRRISEQYNEIRATQLEQKALLEGDRLQKAVRGKRELVERLSNKATRERFDEVEDIFNRE